MLQLVMIVALALQGLPQEFLDKKVREGKEQTGTAIDELTMGQLLKLVALPSARLSQMQCTGYALWLQRNGQSALPDERLDHLHASLGRDAAAFGEMKLDVGMAFVAIYAEEAAEKKKSSTADEFAAWRKSEDSRCASFFEAARDGTLSLRPIAPASIIDPHLNGCHAAYRAAAGRKKGEEAASLAQTADRMAALALEGKKGEALAAARLALNDEAAGAALAPVLNDEAEMTQFALCVPRLRRQQAR